MNKSFLISTVTAAALGYSASFATNALVAKASPSQPKQDVIEADVGTGGAQTTLESYLEGWLCSKVVDEFGIDLVDCDADLFKPRGVSIVWESPDMEAGDPPQWRVKSNIKIDGTWVAGEPE